MLPTFLPPPRPPPPAIFTQALLSFHTIAPTSLFFFSLWPRRRVSEVQVGHTRPLPSACARRRLRLRRLLRLASPGRLPSDWLEAPAVMGDGCSRAPHPARPTKRERETLPGAFSSPASLYCARRQQSFSAARGKQEKKETRPLQSRRRARSGRCAACHPKAGR